MTKKILGVYQDFPAHWVGDGFPVRNIFSFHTLGQTISPFLLLDFLGPASFESAQHQRGVGEHPHRGFETVTILYKGELEHRDSAGNAGKIGPGDVQWMTAASGVVHEELHSKKFTETGGTILGLQLWVNLPKKDKMTSPRYQDISAAKIRKISISNGGSFARIIAGECLGISGPAKTFTPINLWDLDLKAADSIDISLPSQHTAALFVLNGKIEMGDATIVTDCSLILFDPNDSQMSFKVCDDTTAMFLGGAPLNEPVVSLGPFVMNTQAEVRQAYADYQQGKMGKLG